MIVSLTLLKIGKFKRNQVTLLFPSHCLTCLWTHNKDNFLFIMRHFPRCCQIHDECYNTISAPETGECNAFELQDYLLLYDYATAMCGTVEADIACSKFKVNKESIWNSENLT